MAPVWGHKFLGYCLYRAAGEVRRAVSTQALGKLRERIRQLTRRKTGRGLEQIVRDLRVYVLGWKAYFRLAQTPRVMRSLDAWLRHRLRAIRLKQWCQGPTIFRELRALGVSKHHAAVVAANGRRWWRNSRMHLNHAMPIAYFDRLGIPRFS